ncbi:hypothetical protein KIMH_09400 [Bombiscardovia apis]|uniref:Alcohol dehydrogenase n=1 Tax=Bombiscardovia apis TaxID=2932182 RepID=A0ABM8BD41_9BIFI|nr:alcohol dehydrogenase [Bombiscardovia apis]BDR54829.1 hypothetical protein KIMH_09400 [Bombiscardovia apis]
MSTQRIALSMKPWSYFASLVVGALSGLIGTLSHRMGATMPVPYGLIIAFVLLLSSSWWARLVAGIIGSGLHIIGACGIIWLFMGYGPGGDVLIPIASPAFTTLFDRNAGSIWMFGALLLQVLLLLFPARWFADHSSEPLQAAPAQAALTTESEPA